MLSPSLNSLYFFYSPPKFNCLILTADLVQTQWYSCIHKLNSAENYKDNARKMWSGNIIHLHVVATALFLWHRPFWRVRGPHRMHGDRIACTCKRSQSQLICETLMIVYILVPVSFQAFHQFVYLSGIVVKYSTLRGHRVYETSSD